MSLKQAIKERILQLNQRSVSIEVFLRCKDKGLGKVKFKKEDLLKVRFEIEESEAALAGIELWEKSKKYKNELNEQFQG